MANVKIILKDGAKMPQYATDGSAAVDLSANIKSPVVIRPGETVAISTGIELDMTETSNLCAKVLPRSGLGKKGLVLANTVGLIDNDYQGEIIVMAHNRNPSVQRQGMGLNTGDSIVIEPDMRLAQLMFQEFIQVELEEVKGFKAATKRGKGGFGSTGTK